MQNNKKLSKETIVQLVMLGILALLLVVLCIIYRNSLGERLHTSFSSGNIKAIWSGLFVTAIISLFGFIIGLMLGLVTCLVEGLRSQNSSILSKFMLNYPQKKLDDDQKQILYNSRSEQYSTESIIKILELVKL